MASNDMDYDREIFVALTPRKHEAYCVRPLNGTARLSGTVGGELLHLSSNYSSFFCNGL